MAHLSSVVVSAEVRNIAASCSSTAPQGTGSVVTSRSSAPCRSARTARRGGNGWRGCRSKGAAKPGIKLDMGPMSWESMEAMIVVT